MSSLSHLGIDRWSPLAQPCADSPAQLLTLAYIEAFAAGDLTRCIAFFSDDVPVYVEYPQVRFVGTQMLRDWHRARFNAGLRLVRIDRISTVENCVLIEGAVTSKRLLASRISQINGHVVFHFEQGKITRITCALHETTAVEFLDVVESEYNPDK